MVERSPCCCFVEDIHKVGARSHIEAVRTRLKKRATVFHVRNAEKNPPKPPADMFVIQFSGAKIKAPTNLEFLES